MGSACTQYWVEWYLGQFAGYMGRVEALANPASASNSGRRMGSASTRVRGVAETVFLLQVTVRERLVICALQLLASFVSAPFGSVNVGAILGESGW